MTVTDRRYGCELRKHDEVRCEKIAETGEVEFLGFGAGMEVEFAHAVRKAFKDLGEAGGGHAASIVQTEDVVGGADAMRGEFAHGGGAQRAEDQCDRRVIAGLADEADESEAARNEFGQRQAEDGGMEVQVSVAVKMAGWESEFREAPELRGDLPRQRCAGARIEGVAQARFGGRFDEVAMRVGERGDFARVAVAKRQVQPDSERGIAARDAHGFLDVRLVDHEAGVGEQAGLVMAFDGFVDGVAAAEIVAGEDEVAGSIQFSVFSFQGRTMPRVCSEKLNTEY